MWKLKLSKWTNLKKTSRLNINTLSALCEDLSSLHINNFCISLPKYGIRTRLFDTRAHEYGEVQIIFEQQTKYRDCTVLEMHARIYLGRHTIEAVVVGDASYSINCDYYDANLQDYLFTYFANIISSDTYLAKFGKLELPEKLSSYYPECDWTPSIKVSYHRDMLGDPLSVECISGRKSMPMILQTAKKKEEKKNGNK